MFKTLTLSVCLLALGSASITAQKALPDKLTPYFTLPSSADMAPDSEGFLRHWLLLDPIVKPNRSNVVFTDSYLREAFAQEWYKGQTTDVPKAGSKVKVVTEEEIVEGSGWQAKVVGKRPLKQTLRWHALESRLYNVKLFRFATAQGLKEYGVLFHAVTVIDCPEDITDVRLSVGSNSASMWWIDGREAVLLSGDRRMVRDDVMSQRLTLTKGRHVLRGAIINGPGMSDFCVRFLKEDGTPVTNINLKYE